MRYTTRLSEEPQGKDDRLNAITKTHKEQFRKARSNSQIKQEQEDVREKARSGSWLAGIGECKNSRVCFNFPIPTIFHVGFK